MIKEIETMKSSVVSHLDFSGLKPNGLELKDREANDLDMTGLESIDYVAAQAQLAKTMRRVCENDTPIAIDGMGKDRVVLMPLEHFQKLTKNVMTK